MVDTTLPQTVKIYILSSTKVKKIFFILRSCEYPYIVYFIIILKVVLFFVVATENTKPVPITKSNDEPPKK